MDPIVNKVAKSGLVTFDLEELHVPGDRALFDISPWLFEELILREKEFRQHVKEQDWTLFQDKLVAVTCSADAIVPTWAFMLITAALAPYAAKVVFGSLQQLEEALYRDKLQAIDPNAYKDQRVIIKGCSKVTVPVAAYVQLTELLRPVAKSIMYGEPCSTVPVFKRTSV